MTAARTSEVIGAIVGEFSEDFTVWTIPASRMKGKREHRVPLPLRAQEIIRAQISSRAQGYAFEGRKAGTPLSNMAMAVLIRRMNEARKSTSMPPWADRAGDEVVSHGFRSTFRDWAGEIAHASREVTEVCLAHANGSATEAAYFHSDLFDRRRELLEKWEQYVLRKQLP